MRSDDITRDPRYGTMAPHHGMPPGHLPVRSYLAVPVKSRLGEVFGGLFFGHPETGRFNERTGGCIVGVAAQAAIAIDNARLYEAAQRRSPVASAPRPRCARRTGARTSSSPPSRTNCAIRWHPSARRRSSRRIRRRTDAQKRWSHEVITRQVQHMSLLLDDLLDISRITRGTLELRRKRTRARRCHRVGGGDGASRHRYEAPLARRYTCRRCRCCCDVDPLRLAQVLSNLLTNAAKYTDPEGHIRLEGECAGGEVADARHRQWHRHRARSAAATSSRCSRR